MRSAFAAIIKQANVGCVVETGTNDGSSTVVLAAMADKVWTVEIDADLYSAALLATEPFGNVEQVLGSSDEQLALNLPRLCAETFPRSVLCMLDSHWYSHWPIFGELAVINEMARQGYKLTIVIDDWFVEGAPQFAGCFGGLRAADAKGQERSLIPCEYDSFAEHLDGFLHWYDPIYPEGGIGFSIFSDFDLDLGPDFRKNR